MPAVGVRTLTSTLLKLGAAMAQPPSKLLGRGVCGAGLPPILGTAWHSSEHCPLRACNGHQETSLKPVVWQESNPVEMLAGSGRPPHRPAQKRPASSAHPQPPHLFLSQLSSSPLGWTRFICFLSKMRQIGEQCCYLTCGAVREPAGIGLSKAGSWATHRPPAGVCV